MYLVHGRLSQFTNTTSLVKRAKVQSTTGFSKSSCITQMMDVCCQSPPFEANVLLDVLKHDMIGNAPERNLVGFANGGVVRMIQ